MTSISGESGLELSLKKNDRNLNMEWKTSLAISEEV